MSKTFFVTGGAGFIGSAVVRELLNNTDHTVVNVDKLTYAGNLESLESVAGNSRYTFIQADICDSDAMSKALAKHQPDIIMHLAAESHVDRSIDGPAAFMETNIIGTYTLLEAARQYWNSLDDTAQQAFRFHHISAAAGPAAAHGAVVAAVAAPPARARDDARAGPGLGARIHERDAAHAVRHARRHGRPAGAAAETLRCG